MAARRKDPVHLYCNYTFG